MVMETWFKIMPEYDMEETNPADLMYMFRVQACYGGAAAKEGGVSPKRCKLTK